MSHKFTKTQQILMKRLKENGLVVVDAAYGRGPDGGKISTGNRETQAALSLVKAGFLVYVKSDTCMLPNHGYTIHVSSRFFKGV